jgi:membrane fusion protein (multidrug efflux system)
METIMNDSTPPMTERQSKLSRRMILLVGIPTVAIIGAAAAYLMGGRYVSTDNAYVAAQKIIVTPSVAGRVISIAVTEGQRVKPGDALFVIDPGSYELAVKQADAHLAQTITGFESLGITLKSTDRQMELAKETLNLRQPIPIERPICWQPRQRQKMMSIVRILRSPMHEMPLKH